MSKKQCLRMESLPHEVVELILERLPVKSLLRFKAVSNQWKTTMESRYFHGRQLHHRQQSGDPDVMFCVDPDLSTLVLGSSSSLEVPTPWQRENAAYTVCDNSCDGLVCFPDPRHSVFVFNPTTRWYRALPLSGLQLLEVKLGRKEYYKLRHTLSHLGFGKDKITGTYKPVWLYDSAEIGLENVTTCEVFDFNTNAWRYVTPTAPHRLVGLTGPVYVDGSLHWFTACPETKVVSFDLHTESFQVMAKAPFANAPVNEIIICNLDNRFCVSRKKCSNQVIWSFNSGNKTWDILCSIDLDATSLWFDIQPIVMALSPLALLDGDDKKKKKKKKLLFHDRVSHRSLVTYDLETKTYDTAFSAESILYPVCYFPSLFSVL